MAWLSKHTTVKGLSSSEKEMLVAIMKLNEIKVTSNNCTSELQSQKPLFSKIPLVSRIYRSYKQNELKRQLVLLDKITKKQTFKGYHALYVAAQKLFKVNNQFQSSKNFYDVKFRQKVEKHIQALRKLLIKVWRDLTTQRFPVQDHSHLQEDKNTNTTSHMLTQLKCTQPRQKCKTTAKQQKPKNPSKRSQTLTPIPQDKNVHLTTVNHLCHILQKGYIKPDSSHHKNRLGLWVTMSEFQKATAGSSKWDCGIVLNDASQGNSVTKNPRETKHNLRFWTGLPHNLLLKENNVPTKHLAFLFFKDQQVFEQFKAKIQHDPLMIQYVQAMSGNKQIQIGYGFEDEATLQEDIESDVTSLSV